MQYCSPSTNIMPYVSPYMPHYCATFHFAYHSFAICFCYTTQYYCAVFHFAPWVRISQNAEWHRCCLCGHWFTQVFKKIATEPNNDTNEYHNIRITISWQTYGWVSQTNTTFCLWLDGPYHDLLKPATPTISKRNTYLWEAIAPIVYLLHYTTLSLQTLLKTQNSVINNLSSFLAACTFLFGHVYCLAYSL